MSSEICGTQLMAILTPMILNDIDLLNKIAQRPAESIFDKAFLYSVAVGSMMLTFDIKEVIDNDYCTGCGTCVAIAPETFEAYLDFRTGQIKAKYKHNQTTRIGQTQIRFVRFHRHFE